MHSVQEQLLKEGHNAFGLLYIVFVHNVHNVHNVHRHRFHSKSLSSILVTPTNSLFLYPRD